MEFQVIIAYGFSPYKIGRYVGGVWREVGSFDNEDHARAYCNKLNNQEPSALEESEK